MEQSGIIAKAKQRAIYIDVLRIIACIMVIFNHTNERGFYRYVTDTPGTMLSIWNLFFSIACKSAVPIFFMMSGSIEQGSRLKNQIGVFVSCIGGFVVAGVSTHMLRKIPILRWLF
jgi:surface polysaccharide O-acyltransferase-like enzyme